MCSLAKRKFSQRTAWILANENVDANGFTSQEFATILWISISRTTWKEELSTLLLRDGDYAEDIVLQEFKREVYEQGYFTGWRFLGAVT